MPTQPPPRFTLYLTRGTTYAESFGVRGRADDVDDVAGVMIIKRRDSRDSTELLRLTAVNRVDDPVDDYDTLWFDFTASLSQTQGLPGGSLWWGFELTENDGGVSERVMEGTMTVND